MFYLERTISVEEKIRRAEEIYNRRKENENKNTTARVNLEKKKNTSALKKMRNQIIICILIYFIFYGLANSNLIFSKEFRDKANEVLSYEVDFKEIYLQICNYLDSLKFELINQNEKGENNTNVKPDENQNLEENNNQEINNQQTDEKQNNSIENTNQDNNQQSGENIHDSQDFANTQNLMQDSIGGANEGEISEPKELTEEEQMKKDAEEIKNSINFIIPVQGTITSRYGVRNPTVSTVSKFHTGLDIGTTEGKDIISATDGKVILHSTTGDYGKHLKIEKDDVIIIYAHCSKLLVNEGEEVRQGQKIAEVGSTGNSTGPHLHFEIRKSGRYIDPQLILDI